MKMTANIWRTNAMTFRSRWSWNQTAVPHSFCLGNSGLKYRAIRIADDQRIHHAVIRATPEEKDDFGDCFRHAPHHAEPQFDISSISTHNMFAAFHLDRRGSVLCSSLDRTRPSRRSSKETGRRRWRSGCLFRMLRVLSLLYIFVDPCIIPNLSIASAHE